MYLVKMKFWLTSAYREKVAIRSACYRKLRRFDRTGNGKILKPEVKNIFLKSLSKLYRNFYSRVSISTHTTTVEVKSIEYFFGFSDRLNPTLNRFLGLRFAWPNFPHPSRTTPGSQFNEDMFPSQFGRLFCI